MVTINYRTLATNIMELYSLDQKESTQLIGDNYFSRRTTIIFTVFFKKINGFISSPPLVIFSFICRLTKLKKDVRKITTPIYARPTEKTYLGNSDPDHMEVHDLENEDTSLYACQIDEIIEAGNAVVFDPDTLKQARQDGYDNCAYCIGGSTR